ncbi:NUDIX hydrolase [Halopseudomonas maritima]|uniref:NUDIX hydrolase n=1 Tax=Halopseudomonas maritima TaxID=2918528 RepID=UPI001EEAAE76|nr:NUDIX domain-containing protein [Halopseudomonas maritima]UJJ30882.1 NUDIX domain-containing protein [Halopseudomonas maritima]
MDHQQVEAYLKRSGAERVVYVDEHDQPLGEVTRAEAQARGLITRCTFIFVFNSRGELCVHQRTAHKRLYPAFWDVAAGGVVAAGESYLQGAERELAEELGVQGVPLTEHFRFYFDAPDSRLWAGVFSCRWDGPLRLQPEEVQAARWVDLRGDWRRAGEQYAPDSQEALARLLKHPSLDLSA